MRRAKRRNNISLIPYYGGKNKMSPLIVSMLDYDTTDIYMEIFGGGGSVLLNKAPHKKEIYNDGGKGVATLFELLANDKTSLGEEAERDTAQDLIDELYKAEATEETFARALSHKNRIEDSILMEEIKQVNKILSKTDKEEGTKTKNKFNEQLRNVYELPKDEKGKSKGKAKGKEEKRGRVKEIEINAVLEGAANKLNPREYKILEGHIKNINVCINHYIESGKNILSEADEKEIIEKATEKINRALSKSNWIEKNTNKLIDSKDKEKVKEEWLKVYDQLCNNVLKKKFYDSSANESELTYEEKIELAVSTFIVYRLSRDGAGRHYGIGHGDNAGRFRLNEDYLKKVDELYEIAERLKGVKINQVDAFLFFTGMNRNTGEMEIKAEYSEYNKENVMMYLDPTYLKEGKEEEEEKSDSKSKRLVGLKEEYNPGELYKVYWTYEDHEAFLKAIQRAKCKILLSNYDDRTHLYKRYLEEGEGLNEEERKEFKPWKRLEYETKTLILNTNKDLDRTRTECLWYNYEI